MPEISRFLGIIIAMYYSEHTPRHFHARYGEHQVEIAIETLTLLAGKLPPRVMGLVIEWASRHQAELMDNWHLARQQAELKAIAPLEGSLMFLIDVTAVKPLTNRRLELTFADGLRNIVALDDIIARYSGVFTPLLDDQFFQRVSVNHELGTVTWPNGADLCPDVLYSFAAGKPIIVDGQRVMN